MRSKIVNDVIEGNVQVLEHCVLSVRIVIERNVSVKDAPVACFLDISCYRKDHPERVIGEVAADISITLLCERLVLVIASAVRKLCRSDVDESFSCTLRDLVYKS